MNHPMGSLGRDPTTNPDHPPIAACEGPELENLPGPVDGMGRRYPRGGPDRGRPAGPKPYGLRSRAWPRNSFAFFGGGPAYKFEAPNPTPRDPRACFYRVSKKLTGRPEPPAGPSGSPSPQSRSQASAKTDTVIPRPGRPWATSNRMSGRPRGGEASADPRVDPTARGLSDGGAIRISR